jgi:hypothetical protein
MAKASSATGDTAFFETAASLIGSRFSDYVGEGPEEEEVEFDEFIKTQSDEKFVRDTEAMIDAKPDYLEAQPDDLEEVSFAETPARSPEDQKQFIEEAFSGVKNTYSRYKSDPRDVSALIDFFEGAHVLSSLMDEYEIAKRAEDFATACANQIAKDGEASVIPLGPKALKVFLVSDGFREKVYMPAKEVYTQLAKQFGGV